MLTHLHFVLDDKFLFVCNLFFFVVVALERKFAYSSTVKRNEVGGLGVFVWIKIEDKDEQNDYLHCALTITSSCAISSLIEQFIQFSFVIVSSCAQLDYDGSRPMFLFCLFLL